MADALQAPAQPPADCPLCPRLVSYRAANHVAHPEWFNGAVPIFAATTPPRLLIVGLAPGLQGANRTGRPFTGDFAGLLLYETLLAYGFAAGAYAARPDDGLRLVDCAIVNAVRCAPPANKPLPSEIATCRPFLASAMRQLAPRVILALGRIAHDSTLRASGVVPARHAFAHAAEHALPSGALLIDSYHCSRYNTQTGRLTAAMFAGVVRAARQHVERPAAA